MNDTLKNPVAVFFAGLIILWLVFYLLKIVSGLFWLAAIVFIILFAVQPRFKRQVQQFLRRIFR